jgi:hypothetical protein
MLGWDRRKKTMLALWDVHHMERSRQSSEKRIRWLALQAATGIWTGSFKQLKGPVPAWPSGPFYPGRILPAEIRGISKKQCSGLN